MLPLRDRGSGNAKSPRDIDFSQPCGFSEVRNPLGAANHAFFVSFLDTQSQAAFEIFRYTAKN